MRTKIREIFTAVLLLSLPAGAAPYVETFDDDAPTTSGSAEPMQSGPQGGKMIASRHKAEPPRGGSIEGRIDVKKIPGLGNVLRHAVGVNRGSTNASTSSTLGNAVELPRVAETSFQISADVLLDAAVTDSPFAANLGLVLLGHGSDIIGMSPDRYQVLLQMTGPKCGLIQITEVTGSVNNPLVTSEGGTPLSIADDREYHFEVMVTYAVAGDRRSPVTITAKVSSGSEVQTATYTDPTPRTGDFFGVRSSVNVGSASSVASGFEAEFDNFAVQPGGALEARKYSSPKR